MFWKYFFNLCAEKSLDIMFFNLRQIKWICLILYILLIVYLTDWQIIIFCKTYIFFLVSWKL